MIVEVIEGVTVYAAGIATGGVAFHALLKPPDQEELRKFLTRVVNVEAVEERERLLKVRMARQGLKSVRTDGGPNAQIKQMRIRPRPRTGR